MGDTTDNFEAFCRDKGLTQAELDMIARELSARVANTTNTFEHFCKLKGTRLKSINDPTIILPEANGFYVDRTSPYIGPSKEEFRDHIDRLKEAIGRNDIAAAQRMIDEFRPKLIEGDRNLSALLGDSVTNDEQAEYGKEGDQRKREPMLSNNEIYDESYRADLVQPDSYGDGWDSPNSEANWAIGAKWTRERYEDLIDNGVLAVVKMAGIDAEGNCTECGWDADHRYPFSKCCPGCGAIVVEQ